MQEKNNSRIFTPLKINKMEIKNRIVMAPMGIGGLVDENGFFTKRARDYYIQRAKGGTGLIITGAAKVENKIEEYEEGVFPEVSKNPSRFIETTSEMTERIHAYDAKIILQLAVGCGRVAAPHLLKKQPVAPSPISNYWDPSIQCRELTISEIKELIEKTVDAARISQQAGFDGVEIHAVHEGYLLDQFSLSIFNERQDIYGGDLKGRLRFPVEIVEGIKSVLGKDFPVLLRYSIKSFIKELDKGALNGEDFAEKGRDVEEGLEAAKILVEAGYDSLDVDCGSYDSWYWSHPPVYQARGCYLPYTKELNKVVDVPVITSGRLGLTGLAEKVVEDNLTDMVGLGRPLLADPDWPNKVLKNETEDIRPCLGCHVGCLGRVFETRPLSCAVNPSCGREEEFGITEAKKRKNIAVIGGGVAGLEAARVSALRGHSVTLYEKRSFLGGHVIDAGRMEFKGEEEHLIKWYKRQLDKENVDVRLNKLITTDTLDLSNIDEVIVATGSKTLKPNIEGIENDNVSFATELQYNNQISAEKIVIIGGGLVGCETAYWFAKQDKEVIIIEQLDELMKSGIKVPHSNRNMLRDLLDYYNTKIYTNCSCWRITPEGVTIKEEDRDKDKEITADAVIIATGLERNNELYKYLSSRYTNIYLAGDARNPRGIMQAIWEANEICRNL